MNTSRLSLRYPASAAALAASIIALPPSLHAAAYSWDGGNTTAGWGAAANWNPDGAPVFDSTADLTFNATPNTTGMFLGSNRIVRSVTFGDNMDAAVGVSFNANNATANSLTFQAASGNATLTITSGAAGNITLGNVAGVGTAYGNLVLGSSLDVVHNGTGTLLINRPITGSGSLTKTGTGTLELRAFNTFNGALNINQGTVIAGAQTTTGQDINSVSSINLGGGTLHIRPNFANKAYDTAPVVVSSASTLVYENQNAFSYTLGFGGTGSFALNANLAVKNISTDTTLVSGVNISRAITGTGTMTVETFNNISSSTSNYSLGRVLLSGDNSSWSGDLVIAKGTVSLSGNGVNSSGTGGIVIGTTSDAFGAGLTFFPTGANATTASYANNITVRSGGFRSIKGSNTDHNILFTGDVALEGTLNVDHTLSAAGRRMTFDGDISGAGGLNITNAAGNANTGVILNGVNTFLGATNVASGAALGGDGSVSGDISFASGANFIFNTAATLDVTGNVSFDGFGIANLIGLDVNTVAGTYMLLNGTGSNISQTNVSNIGAGNAFDLGGGVSYAYFDFTGGDLSVVVGAIPEPGSFAAVGGLAALAFAGLRRRRRSA